jgi:hypothetical protein
MRRRERIWKLRAEQQRQLVARLLFQGLPTAKIAKRLHMSAESTRDLKNSPEFQTVYRAYETEMLKTIDRAMPKLLLAALVALAKLLKHPDWRAREAAIEKIIRPHGSMLERLTGSGVPRSADPTPASAIPVQAMSDDQRELARKLFRSIRSAQPQPGTPSSIVSRVSAINGGIDQN